MKRSLRYLRIAFSATSLIACVLLIVLWVRSYYQSDFIARTSSNSMIGIVVNRGMAVAGFYKTSLPSWLYSGGTKWTIDSQDAQEVPKEGFRWYSLPGVTA